MLIAYANAAEVLPGSCLRLQNRAFSWFEVDPNLALTALLKYGHVITSLSITSQAVALRKFVSIYSIAWIDSWIGRFGCTIYKALSTYFHHCHGLLFDGRMRSPNGYTANTSTLRTLAGMRESKVRGSHQDKCFS